MRVLILHSRYLSGPVSGENRVVEDEATLLRDGGHEVDVVDPEPETTSIADVIRRGTDAVWARQAARGIARRLTEARPDVVHCHNLFPMFSPAVIRVARSFRVPVVMTLHNYRLLCLPATFVRDGRVCEDCLGRLPWPGVLHACYRDSRLGSTALAASLAVHRALRTFDRPTLYLAPTPFVKRKYVEAGWVPHRIRIKSNFAWDAPRREDAGEYFLYVGRLSPEKGLATLMRVWREVGARLVVVGDGPDLGSLKSAAPVAVEFVGAVPPAEITAMYGHAKALLMPSICYEAQPRSVLEAYACGVPVVATEIGGLSDSIVHGTTGILVRPGDQAGWVDAVRRLLLDAESHRLGEGARRLWQERFSPAKALTALESTYERARSIAVHR